MKKNNFLIAILFATTALIGYSCGKSTAYTAPGGGGGGPTGFATDSISMSGTMFNPKVDTVHVGHTVKWQNNDGFSHTATSDDGGTTFNSGTVLSGTFATFTPTVAGTITYHCAFHQSMGMVGTLIVKP